MSNLIPNLVSELKKYNSEIGVYESYIINVELNHFVKFSNGFIEIPKYFFEEYRDQPSAVGVEQLKLLAMTFEKKVAHPKTLVQYKID
jgi:hypothetical protein